MAGALPEAEFAPLAAAAGLVDGAITERFEAYADTSVMDKLSKDLRVRGINFRAVKRPLSVQRRSAPGT